MAWINATNRERNRMEREYGGIYMQVEKRKQTMKGVQKGEKNNLIHAREWVEIY